MPSVPSAAEPSPDAVLERVVARLREVDGVAGLVLGGSRARGAAAPGADVDVGIYYRRDTAPDTEALRAAARDLDDRGEPDGFGAYGEWGPWIDGGAWLRVEGTKTDLLFREIERVEAVLDACEAGTLVTAYQPGHPHCFVNHVYAGEVHDNVVLFDADGTMARLRERTDPYPEQLAGALVRTFGWEAKFALETAATAAKRGDVAYVTGCLYRSVACMVQALFAANRTYLVNEKGAVGRVGDLARHPQRFAQRVAELLARPGDSAEALQSALDAALELQVETQSMLEGASAAKQ
ncbi:MAG TPA: nucleotidyltransferase domain-containing protein [Solirubrobacterales bacterium]|nr:nucleotidyltransferase domain-containing protein [Solirubrobacterales bacterium]